MEEKLERKIYLVRIGAALHAGDCRGLAAQDKLRDQITVLVVIALCDAMPKLLKPDSFGYSEMETAIRRIADELLSTLLPEILSSKKFAGKTYCPKTHNLSFDFTKPSPILVKITLRKYQFHY